MCPPAATLQAEPAGILAVLDWDDLRYFLAVQRTGTLARAAGLLHINATTVGRRLAALEERAGARLFDRTPEGFVLTPAGRDLLPRAEHMEQQALAIEREIIGADQRLAGVVRVNATEMLATRFIAPQLPRFSLKRLARREADIALRLARPEEDDVVTRRLASIELRLYAAPSYLEARGVPPDPEHSLAGHDAILFADSRAFNLENDWFLPRLDGANIVLRSDSVSSIYSAAVSGLGIALLPRAVAEHEPALRRIETASSPEPRVVWQAVHSELQKSARVRVVLDFLTEVIGGPA
jgi:DNA-binding transcriptional LysR family regulator